MLQSYQGPSFSVFDSLPDFGGGSSYRQEYPYAPGVIYVGESGGGLEVGGAHEIDPSLHLA
jgi:hypothetical protein